MAAPCVHPVSLPSIHEMFPAHLLRPQDEFTSRQKHSRSQSSHSPVLHPYSETIALQADTRSPHAKRSASHVYSFDVLRSDPMNSSLQHLTSTSGNLLPNPQHQHNVLASPSFRVSVPPTTASNIHNSLSRSRAPQRTDPDPAVPAIISFPISRPPAPSKPNQSPPDDASDDDAPGDSAGKKHICPTCLKRFNRPSSLRIHVNTHTGATPFRCPWPNCGREFNVNSNMRRHYRNHTTPGFSRAQPNDTRRKRRRMDALEEDPLSHPVPVVDHRRPHHPSNLMPSPPISHFSASDDSEYDSEMDYSIHERDEFVDHRTKPPAYSLTQSMARVAVATKPQHEFSSPYSATPRYHQRQHYSYGDPRPLTPGSSFHSSSSSSSPSPRLQPASMPSAPHNGHHSYSHAHTNSKRDSHKYNPSAPYMHSLADTRVSTALRPAFHS